MLKEKKTFIDTWNIENKRINIKELPINLRKNYKLRKEQVEYNFKKNNNKEINYYRNLLNQPANKINPEIFCKEIKKKYKKNKKLNIIEKDINELKKENFNLITSVDNYNAKLLICEYKINKTKPIIIIGKGVTFDTGGYNLKDGNNIENMHLDKTGGCMALYILDKIMKKKVNKNIIVLVPLVENNIHNKSTKPGDIIKSYNGKTVEITDIDAEGRLIVADCLSYCIKNYNYKYIIDMGTFTAMNNCYISYSYFTESKKLSKNIEKEAKIYSEKIFKNEPIIEYKNLYKSNRGDLVNYVNNIECTESQLHPYFLLNFMEKDKKRWIHINLSMMSVNSKYSILEGSESLYNFVKKL
jgi:leucyl aminopeptidase